MSDYDLLMREIAENQSIIEAENKRFDEELIHNYNYYELKCPSQHVKQVLKDSGYIAARVDNDFVYDHITEKYVLELSVDESTNGAKYLKVALCPAKCFDRWSNSRHITFNVYASNSNVSLEERIKHFKSNLKDAHLIMNKLPKRLFNNGVTITL